MNAVFERNAGSRYAARLLRVAAAGGSGKALSLRPMPSRASEDAIHARSWFSRPPVRQEALFTHGVCFYAL